MVMRPFYELDGGRELRQQLRQAGADMQQLKDAHLAAAEIVARAASALAPVLTGRLRDTIRAAGTQTAAIVRSGYKRIPYGGPIHWGWPTRPDKRKKWQGGAITANPFLSRAAQDTEGTWLRLYEAHVDKVLDQIKGDRS